LYFQTVSADSSAVSGSTLQVFTSGVSLFDRLNVVTNQNSLVRFVSGDLETSVTILAGYACAVGTHFSSTQADIEATSGESLCQLCDAGTYVNAVNQTDCLPCSSGSFSASRGSTSCATCPSGRYSLAGATTCLECPQGQYGVSNSSRCYDCPLASASNLLGVSNCSFCLPGKYADKAGSRECTGNGKKC